MEFKKIAKNSFDFLINRFIELLGFCICSIGFVLLISLISYSPEDPNFLLTGEKEIKNILGFRGSFVSDIFFQSIGLISILVAITIFITGINIFRTKNTIILLVNLFFTVLYSLFGSLFFTFFYSESFWLSINGNGGFVGKFLEGNFIFSIIDLNQKIYFYLLILIIFIFFLLSINFHPKKFVLFIKSLARIKFLKKKEVQTSNEEIKEVDAFFQQNNETLTQENFSFST